jgi:hypothetical protein
MDATPYFTGGMDRHRDWPRSSDHRLHLGSRFEQTWRVVAARVFIVPPGQKACLDLKRWTPIEAFLCQQPPTPAPRRAAGQSQTLKEPR